MFFCYILYSGKIDRYYVGVCADLEIRLERHNSGWGKYTKRGIPWKIVHFENFLTKSEALKRERQIKKMKSRKYIESILENAGGRPD